jgi:hypothetical protein
MAGGDGGVTIRKTAEQGRVLRRIDACASFATRGKIIGYSCNKGADDPDALLVSVLNAMPNSWNLHDWVWRDPL